MSFPLQRRVDAAYVQFVGAVCYVVQTVFNDPMDVSFRAALGHLSSTDRTAVILLLASVSLLPLETIRRTTSMLREQLLRIDRRVERH